jgi:hypothetical protein
MQAVDRSDLFSGVHMYIGLGTVVVILVIVVVVLLLRRR